jgi:carbonic anhydrase
MMAKILRHAAAVLDKIDLMPSKKKFYRYKGKFK